MTEPEVILVGMCLLPVTFVGIGTLAWAVGGLSPAITPLTALLVAFGMHYAALALHLLEAHRRTARGTG
jgi:hypothetical protein